jgi:mRNA-degrading endonuclease RelE of RelBE toxin-antitoxin system
MFTFDLTDVLRKKLKKLGKKDKVLANNFYKKINEIIQKDINSIHTYKNLKSPMNEYKRIHLTDNFILLFIVEIKNKHIVFINIKHRKSVYK